MEPYRLSLIECAATDRQPIGCSFTGQFNAGVYYLPFTFAVLQGNGHCALVDTGIDPASKDIAEACFIDKIQFPDEMLGRIGLTPGDIDTILLTHAHYDHAGNLSLFPNAKIFLQREELESWRNVLSLPSHYRQLSYAVCRQDIEQIERLSAQGRLILVEGEQKNVLPGIDLVPVFDAHSFGEQLIVIHSTTSDEQGCWVLTGDTIFSLKNLTGNDNDGAFITPGIGVGSQLGRMRAMDEIMALCKGNLDRIVIAHDGDSWDRYETACFQDGLHCARVNCV